MSKLQANVLLVQIYEKRKKTIKLNHDIEGIINGLAFGLYLLSVLIYLFIISRYLDINSFSDILGLYHKRCSVNGFLIAIHLISLVFCGFVIVFEGYESKEKGFFIESFSFFFGISIYIFALVLYQYKCLSHWSSFYGIFGQIFDFILYYILMLVYSMFLMLCGFGLFYVSLVLLRWVVVILATSPQKINLYFLSKALRSDVVQLEILMCPIISSAIKFMGGGTLDEVYKEVCKAVNLASTDLLEYFLQRIEDIEIVQLNEEVFYKSKLVFGGSNMETVILDDE